MWVYLNESPDATPEFLVYTDLTFDEQATPTIPNAVFVTDFGEIVQEYATPSIFRFVDLTSRVDIRSFRGAFTNSLNGLEQVNFSLNVYESDSPDGPWLLSTTTSSMAIGTLLLSRNAKRYTKFEVVIDSELTDLSVLNFVLLVEIAIADPNSPVLSRAAKNVLRKFPSWTSIYKDSEDRDNQDLFIPQSTGGKFLQAIINDNLDLFESQVDLHNINKFIGSADINQIAWVYSSHDVSNTFNKILGDGIELTRVSDIFDFYDARAGDYVFYHNPANRQILTLKKFETLVSFSVNSSPVLLNQAPFLRFNWFDEFGARVGLNRLYLEDNVSFRYRILDSFKNRPSSDIEGFKKTLRRELNLWKAFGVEGNDESIDQYYDSPNAATPEIMEMYDIEYSLDYFNLDGSPKQKFKDLVKYLNEKYPTAWGYFRFNDALWDTAGFSQEGVDRIKSQYLDEINNFEYYQSGVGDFSDAKVIVENNSANPEYFDTTIYATGKRKVGSTPYYSPINIEYEYNGSYTQYVYNNQYATVNFTLEAILLPYQNYSSSTNVYATFSQKVKNVYGPNSSASPEFHVIPIFDTEGYTSDNIIFKNKLDNQPIVFSDTTSSEYNKIPFNKLYAVSLRNGIWNGTSYATPNSNNFTAFLSNIAEPLTSSKQKIGGATPISGATPFYLSPFDDSLQIKIVSNIYNLESISGETAKIKSDFVLNELLSNSESDYIIPTKEIESNIIYPYGATPTHVNIYGVIPTNGFNVPGYYEDGFETIDVYGGISYDPEKDLSIFVPSSPNIVATAYGATAGSFGLFNTTGSTHNYYFGKLKYSLSSTPNQIIIKSLDGEVYPFEEIEWDPFILEASPRLTGYVDEYGYISSSLINADRIPGLNSDIIPYGELTRESFGLSGSSKFDYFFESIGVNDDPNVNISIWSDQKIVKPFLNRSYLTESSVQKAIENAEEHQPNIEYPYDSIVETYDENNNTTFFSGLRVRGKLYDYKIDGKIHTGWIHLSEDEQYIYAKPITEEFSGILKQISLSQTPQQSAPIIVEIFDQDATPVTGYREISFSDSATPGALSFYNQEILKPRQDNSFNLGYNNFYDLSIKDMYTGEIFLEDIASPNSVVYVDESLKKLGRERSYEIRYKLKNSYYIDSEIVNEDIVTKIYFDATPSSTLNYRVTYESSEYEQSTPVSIDLNPFTSSIDTGYVVIAKGDYNFSKIEKIVSPYYLVNDGKDYVDISIFSLDINGNRKPYQSFSLSCNYLTLSSNFVTTDSEGYAHITAVCSPAVIVDHPKFDTIAILGQDKFSNPMSHPNSSSSGYSDSISIELLPTQPTYEVVVYAATSSRLIPADGGSSIYIDGYIVENSIPKPNVVVYWRKSRYLYDLFNSVPYAYGVNDTLNDFSGSVTTDENGRFSIGPFIAQDNTNPGMWFVAVETENSNLGTNYPSTISGDITYWMEDFDPINFNIDDLVSIQDVVNYDNDKTIDLYATPRFVVSYYNKNIIEKNISTPLWVPPKWFSINKYEQYQAGFFGSTPYYVENYQIVRQDILRP